MVTIAEDELVSVIIPTYNRVAMLRDCLLSVCQSTHRALELIVVDNGSTDGTPDMLKAEFPRAQVLRSEVNLLAGRARNLGLLASHGDCFLLLDDDNIVDQDMIRQLRALMMSDPTIGCVGPKMYYASDSRRIFYAGAEISLRTSRTYYRGLMQLDDGQFDEVCETGHVPNIMMLSRAAFERVGLFDERLRMAYEESDYAEMIRRAGFKIMFCPASRAWHRVALLDKKGFPFKFPFRAYYFARNRPIYMRKHASRLNFLVFLLLFYPVFSLYYIGVILSRRRLDHLGPYLCGLFRGLFFGLTGRLL